jgi:hypothetical protein
VYPFQGQMHPAADRNSPPQALRWYHRVTMPEDIFPHMEFYWTTIARAFRAWNSAGGVSSPTWLIISTATVLCPGCRRMFSFAGYKAHSHINVRCQAIKTFTSSAHCHSFLCQYRRLTNFSKFLITPPLTRHSRWH